MTEEDDLRPDQRERITRGIISRDDKPLKPRYYPRNPAMQSVIDTQVDELLRAEAIEPSWSPHSAPIELVKKKSGEWRMCVGYRQLNAHSQDQPHPRMTTSSPIQFDARFKVNGYWQIPMAKDSRQFTAFTVPSRGLYQWKVFGHRSASATFQRALDSVIGAESFASAYLDDTIVIGATD